MTSPLPADQPPRRCPECGAALEEDATHCWLCAGRASLSTPIAADNSAGAREYDDWIIHGSVWLIILVVVVVALGVLNARLPALGWIFGLTVLPALLFTLAGATLARKFGRPWEPLKKFAVFMAAVTVSTLIAALIALLLLLAAVVALLQWCFSGIGPR